MDLLRRGATWQRGTRPGPVEWCEYSPWDSYHKALKALPDTDVITHMTFENFVQEQSDRLTQPIAALVALTDVQLDSLPDSERATLLKLLRVYAVEASEIACELSLTVRTSGVDVDIRDTVDSVAAA